ncbi:unnamed protein product [Moneuplotes crassus]|uniref:Uncharacterized protein n=1 Tax=Euplotes crassus TaxID=5936 RepID=A0AAD2D6E2_EUPCR|nr:unnamed protein product [Moneuplotes crassus]
MIRKEFLPLQEKVEMYFKVEFKTSFPKFASAFLKKYNVPNKYCWCTICQVSDLDEDRFAFVRRYQTTLSRKPYFERVIYNRKSRAIEAQMLEDQDTEIKIAERCIYQQEGDSVIYETFLYKNPGWKSWIRKKTHAWGVRTMKKLLKKEDIE